MRINHLDRHYCRECGVEGGVLVGMAVPLEDGQAQCCRFCGSELTIAAVEWQSQDDMPGIAMPYETPPSHERARH